MHRRGCGTGSGLWGSAPQWAGLQPLNTGVGVTGAHCGGLATWVYFMELEIRQNSALGTVFTEALLLRGGGHHWELGGIVRALNWPTLRVHRHR